MIPDTLVIVFGAGGRLGTRLLPLLAKQPVTVMGIAREHKPADWPRGMHWMQVDVTNPAEWPRSLGALTDIAAVHQRVILVDLLLKRTTVTAMRTSIAATTAYIVRLHNRLVMAGQPCLLAAASTTATLAPWLYQTPYGLAKRRQLAQYAATDLVGAAVLLPSLAETDNEPHRSPLVWTYRQAAESVARAATEHSPRTRGRNFRLIVPNSSTLPETASSPDSIARTLHHAVHSHARLVSGYRDSPQQHRIASHARLALTPRYVRPYFDHHLIPSLLVRRLARTLALGIERTSLYDQQALK